VNRVVVTGPGLPLRVGHYSHAVRAGDLLFVSGQPGVDPATGRAAGTSFAEQARQAFANLEAVLRLGGSRPALVLSTTVSVSRLEDFAELNDLFAEFFPVDPPTRMTQPIPLPRGLLISIGCVAVVAEGV
jgi:2-iminobutanoate/2-iminopropanoate deaminase